MDFYTKLWIGLCQRLISPIVRDQSLGTRWGERSYVCQKPKKIASAYFYLLKKMTLLWTLKKGNDIFTPPPYPTPKVVE